MLIHSNKDLWVEHTSVWLILSALILRPAKPPNYLSFLNQAPEHPNKHYCPSCFVRVLSSDIVIELILWFWQKIQEKHKNPKRKRRNRKNNWNSKKDKFKILKDSLDMCIITTLDSASTYSFLNYLNFFRKQLRPLITRIFIGVRKKIP